MSLPDPRVTYGVHQFTPYNRDTGLPFGTAKVLASSSFNISSELQELFGGSQRFSWAVEEGNFSSDIALNVKQVEDWMIELFLGKAPTASGASAVTTISALTDKKGITIADASTGIASVTAIPSTGDADTKFSRYIIVATGAAAVDIYAVHDADFGRGANAEFQDNSLKVTPTPITVPGTGGTVEFAPLGLRLTGGGGTIAFVTGDTATFEVLTPKDSDMAVRIGATEDVLVEFGAIMIAQKRSNAEMFEVDAFRVKGAGMPMGFNEKAFGESEIPLKAFYDSVKNGVADIRFIDPAA